LLIIFWFIPIYKISYSKIEKIKKCSFKELGPTKLFLLRLGNRFWGDFVLIQKKGFIKSVVITPDNADKFLKKIQQFI
jgi:hypothetical protein